MTCKDCIHNDVCCRLIKPSEFIEMAKQSNDCNLFKDKSKFIELPCFVGDPVYQVDSERIYKSKIKNIIFDTSNFAFDQSAVGKTVFLSREEAEKALKEQVGEK